MKFTAVIGSRKGVPAGHATKLVAGFPVEAIVLVSGGAPGIDQEAESAYLARGGKVISFRPHERDGAYTIDRWRIGFNDGTDGVVDLRTEGHPTWADYGSAAYYRNTLVAEQAHEGFALWDGYSRGTGHAIDAFAATGKKCHVGKVKR